MRKWRTRDGRRLDLSCMVCDHLRNCLARILRLNWRVDWMPYILAEIDRRCKVKPKVPETKIEELV